MLDDPVQIGEALLKRLNGRKESPHLRAAQGLISFCSAKMERSELLLQPFDMACRALAEFKEPLALIVVDPLNAVLRITDTSAEASRSFLRANAVEILQFARSRGVNVLFVCEDEAVAEQDVQFMENIADTVIHLTVDSRKGCQQRFLDVAKSRYQKEAGGKHAFNIGAGVKIEVFPSSAVMAARYASREMNVPRSFGPVRLPGLDKVLGDTPDIRCGDAVAVTGPADSLRGVFAMCFLLFGLAHEEDSGAAFDQVLLLTTRDDEWSVRRTLSSLGQQLVPAISPERVNRDVRVCVLPCGHMQPGYLYQCLRTAFHDAEHEGRRIGRVVLEDVAHLELTCPFVQEDEILGPALLGYLARQGATTLFVCDEHTSSRRGHLQRSIVDGAQNLIELTTYRYRGIAHTGLQVARTRTMQHCHGLFEFAFDHNGPRVESGFALLRQGRGGEMAPIGVRFFLHAESGAQEAYNRQFESSVGAVLAGHVEVSTVDRGRMEQAISMIDNTAIDEVQILQLDEFHARTACALHGEKSIQLHPFQIEEWSAGCGVREDFLGCFDTLAGKTFQVVPYYANIGCLVVKRDLRLPPDLTWRDLAERCGNPETKVSFAFDKDVPENFNCLFFEILLSLANKHPIFPKGECPLRSWLGEQDALEACTLMRRLCRPLAKAARPAQLDTEGFGSEPSACGTASVWRRWFTTLETASKEGLPQRAELEVRPLPGGWAVAGEWYLGVPAHAASPSSGLGFIKTMTSRDCELSRLRQGVGLPTRRGFYEGKYRACSSSGISFEIEPANLAAMFQKAFRRSTFPCYSLISASLAHHLKSMLENPADDTEAAANALGAFSDDLAFMGFEGKSRGPCGGRCVGCGGKGG